MNLHAEQGLAHRHEPDEPESRYPAFRILSASFWDLSGFDLDLVELDGAGGARCFHCVRSSFCRDQLSQKDGVRRCKDFLLSLCARAQRESADIQEPCHGGLLNLAMPLSNETGENYLLLVGRRKHARPDDLSAAARLLELFRPTILQKLLREKTCAAPRAVSPLVAKLAEYLDTHFSEPIQLKTMARQFRASPFYLSHRFSKEMGIPLFAYLARTRIAHAKRMLQERHDQNVTQICFASGFQSISQFNRAFRSQTGMSPSAFRRNN